MVELHPDIASVAQAWDDLADRVKAPPFMRPGWTKALMSSFGGGGALEIYALSEGDRLLAVLPLRRRRKGLEGVTNWHTPAFGILAEDDEACAALLTDLLSRGASRLSLSFLDPANC